jgi:hypothetical protein
MKVCTEEAVDDSRISLRSIARRASSSAKSKIQECRERPYVKMGRRGKRGERCRIVLAWSSEGEPNFVADLGLQSPNISMN